MSEDPYMDPSTMKTEAGRKAAARINRDREVSYTQLHRLRQVSAYFPHISF